MPNPAIDDPGKEFNDHLCIECGDPCDCDFTLGCCNSCLGCQAACLDGDLAFDDGEED